MFTDNNNPESQHDAAREIMDGIVEAGYTDFEARLMFALTGAILQSYGIIEALYNVLTPQQVIETAIVTAEGLRVADETMWEVVALHNTI